MFKKSRYILLVIALIALTSYFEFNQLSTKKPLEKIQIYSETFGNQNNPALLLNAGAGTQMTMWPKEFCQKLADEGYYVIRYDYRNVGQTIAPDYNKQPYNALDLAQDAVNILKKHGKEKANFVGYSMGGQISQVAGAFLADHVDKIILISTSSDFTPGFDMFNGMKKPGGLSPPNEDYLKVASEVFNCNTSKLECVPKYVKLWKYLHNDDATFTEDFYIDQLNESFARTKLPPSYPRHAQSMLASIQLQSDALSRIIAPTLIIQGDRDPIFPMDHGIDMNKKIKSSQLVVLENFAHDISPPDYSRLTSLITKFLKSNNNIVDF